MSASLAALTVPATLASAMFTTLPKSDHHLSLGPFEAPARGASP